MRDGADPICLHCASGLYFANTVEFVLWTRLSTGDYFLYGGSSKHKLRCGQHAELGGEWRDKYRHHAGNLHVCISEWFREREPNGDDHLHADCHQCGRLNHVYAYAHRYSNDPKQTNHQLVHSERHKYHFGLQQHAELGDEWRDQHRYHAGNVHVYISEWFNEREPDRDDYLHVDGFRRSRLNHVDGTGHCDGPWRSINDNHHFMPRRNTRCGVCRLHNRRKRRHSALYVFAEHG